MTSQNEEASQDKELLWKDVPGRDELIVVAMLTTR